MNMPQSMMVLCEADELRWRRNTQVEDFTDDPLETVTKSRTHSIQHDRETFLEKQYLTNHSYSNSTETEIDRKSNSMPAEMLLVKVDE